MNTSNFVTSGEHEFTRQRTAADDIIIYLLWTRTWSTTGNKVKMKNKSYPVHKSANRQSTCSASKNGKNIQESPADAVKPARRKSMPKLLQFDVFRFISPNSISPNCKCIASRGKPIFSEALGLYSCTQFEIRCLPIIKFLAQIAST